ncbi:hypothetical protein [Acaryochloris thomasi]|nr:hypothetical protein [Acaryochloris thomasi]
MNPNRWVHPYGPEFDERTRPHIKPTNDEKGDVRGQISCINKIFGVAA